MGQRVIVASLCIQEVDSCRIGRIPVSHEDDRLFSICGADRLIHGDDGRQCLPGIGHVVGGDLQIPGREEEEDVVLLPHNLDVRLITCADVVDTPLILHIEAMAIKRSRSGIVQN